MYCYYLPRNRSTYKTICEERHQKSTSCFLPSKSVVKEVSNWISNSKGTRKASRKGVMYLSISAIMWGWGRYQGQHWDFSSPGHCCTKSGSRSKSEKSNESSWYFHIQDSKMYTSSFKPFLVPSSGSPFCIWPDLKLNHLSWSRVQNYLTLLLEFHQPVYCSCVSSIPWKKRVQKVNRVCENKYL